MTSGTGQSLIESNGCGLSRRENRSAGSQSIRILSRRNSSKLIKCSYVHDMSGPRCRPRGAKTRATRSHVLILLHSISGPELGYQRIQGWSYCGVLGKNCWSLLQRTSLRYHQRVRSPRAKGENRSLGYVSELRTRWPLQMTIVWWSHSSGSGDCEYLPLYDCIPLRRSMRLLEETA